MTIFYGLITIAILIKFLAWWQFVIIEWDAPFPGEREKYLWRFGIYEFISTLITSYISISLFELFWVWEILIGIFMTWGIEIVLVRLFFWGINAFVDWFFSANVGQKYREKQVRRLIKSYNEFLNETLTEEEKVERFKWLESLRNK